MTLPLLFDHAEADETRPTLFGLLADGSDDARFTDFDRDRTGLRDKEKGRNTFSPAEDWYGRWTIRCLHGVLAKGSAQRMTEVRSDDIVIFRTVKS